MTTKLNTHSFLWAIGILQPVAAGELRAYLATVLDDSGNLPAVQEIHKFCLGQMDQQHLIRVLRDPDLFSLTHLGNQYLAEAQRKSRDKLRIYLLRDAYRSRLKTSREVDASGLDGVAPSGDVRPIEEGTEANKLGPVVPSGRAYWPRYSKQLLDQTGPSPASRDSFLPYLSFATVDQISMACRSRAASQEINLSVLGLMLGISPKLIQQIAREPARHYRSFELPKRGGGVRPIESPRVFLKVIQRFLLDYVLYALPTSNRVYSFRRGVSIEDNALNHVAKGYVANIDIENFFGSITRNQVVRHLRSNDFDEQGALLISALVTKDDVLPQGAATSPAISNSILFEFDSYVSSLAQRAGLTYSRYADDISISGDDRTKVLSLLERARTDLLSRFGLRLNAAKTRVSSRHGQQKVTGLVVNVKAWPTRHFRRQVRAAFHNAARTPMVSDETLCKLHGYLSYLGSFDAMRETTELKHYRKIIGGLRSNRRASNGQA